MLLLNREHIYGRDRGGTLEIQVAVITVEMFSFWGGGLLNSREMSVSTESSGISMSDGSINQ